MWNGRHWRRCHFPSIWILNCATLHHLATNFVWFASFGSIFKSNHIHHIFFQIILKVFFLAQGLGICWNWTHPLLTWNTVTDEKKLHPFSCFTLTKSMHHASAWIFAKNWVRTIERASSYWRPPSYHQLHQSISRRWGNFPHQYRSRIIEIHIKSILLLGSHQQPPGYAVRRVWKSSSFSS